MNKHVYFVRHGESRANKTGVREGSVSPLTEKGREQARRVAERVSQLNVEHVIKSPFTRAWETAEIITASLPETPVEVSELFIERRNPSLMLDKHQEDPALKSVWEEIAKNYHIPDWHHSDEENFADLNIRAQRALAHIESLPHARILVVSHGLFMKMIFAHVLLGDSLTGRIFWDKFIPIKNIENTGILHIEYTDNYHGTGKYWKLVSWNDHAHLT